MKENADSNYLINGMELLLKEDCLARRYYPLIEYKERLICNLLAMGCTTKNDCIKLYGSDFISAGLPDLGMAALFRRFLSLYDYKGKGIKDIPDAASKPCEELAALLELMRLPGVKGIRAKLYYICGIRTLRAIAAADAELLRARIIDTIKQKALPFTPPLPKEPRTQIAVAKLFTEYEATK